MAASTTSPGLPSRWPWGMLVPLTSRRVQWMGALCLVLSAGCGVAAPVGTAELGLDAEPFINGGDDRLEYFELSDPAQRAAFEEFTVVLMTESAAQAVVDGHAGELPTWGDVNQLCESEPFAEQPSAAFCSGVLVDWDLVLTSGHCVDAVPLTELRVAFSYYYAAEGQLATRAEDIYRVNRVIASRRDPEVPDDQGERLDYAWLELEEAAGPPHRPAPVFTRSEGVVERDPVISIGAGGGVPVKWDGGGHVQSTRASYDDYFIADTDTSQGSSGGGVFDGQLAVVGSLARGAADFAKSPTGCFVTDVESDPGLAREQFTYVNRAVEGLCAEGSSSVLCDDACEQPCDAGVLEPPGKASHDDSGCSLGATGRGTSRTGLALIGAAVTALSRRRMLRRARQRSAPRG
jgi:trypsin-like peptidase